MGKDNTALYIGGGLLALLVLPNLLGKETEDTEDGLFPGLNLDFGNLLGGLNLPDFNLSNLTGGFDLPNFQTIIDNALAGITGLVPTMPGLSDLIPDMPGEGYLGFVQETVGQIPYVAPGLGIAGGLATAYATRGLPVVATGAARATLQTLAPRVATMAGVGLGLRAIPILGWVYLAADVATTIYEGVTGQGVAGAWLGQGELLGLTREQGTPQAEGVNVVTQEVAPITSYLEDNPMIPPWFAPSAFQNMWDSILNIFGLFGGRSVEAQGVGISNTLALNEAGWGAPEQPSFVEAGWSAPSTNPANYIFIGGGGIAAPAAPGGAAVGGGGGLSMGEGLPPGGFGVIGAPPAPGATPPPPGSGGLW